MSQESYTPYIFFKTFFAIKTHFTTEDFDFIKYNGKIKISENSFKKRKDYKLFYKLSKMLPENIAVPFLVSQFVNIDVFVPTPAFIIQSHDDAQKVYDEWKERTNNMLDNYRKDLCTLANKSNGSWTEVIKQTGCDYPLLFKCVMSKEISQETYSLLNDLFNQTSKKYKELENDVIFNKLNLKFKKYRCFLNPTVNDVLKITPKNLGDLIEKA